MTSGPPLPADLVADIPPFAGELDEAIVLGELPERAERFRISTVGQAEWAMRKLAALTTRERDVSAQAAEWVERIVWWEEAERRRVAPAGIFFRELLERWALDERARTGEKTQYLPSGEVPTRASRPKVVVVDEGAVIDWAQQMLPTETYVQVVKQTVSVLVGELRRVLRVADDGAVVFDAEDGEVMVVPGVGVEAAEVTAHPKPAL